MTRTRIGIAIVTVAGLTGSAFAQPAPTPAPPAPAPVPPVAPGGEQTPPADEAAPPAEDALPTEPEPMPAPEPAPEPPANPEKMKVGKEGYFQPGLLLQGWFFYDRADAPATSSFRLRRAEIHAKGQIIPDKVAYAVMIDPAKVLEFGTVQVPTEPDPTPIKQPVGAVSAMQDFYITFLHKYVDASIGQFKIPVSWEGYNSSSKLLFPERALASRTYGDKRDLGVRLTKTFEKVMYSAGLFNGAGQNNLDNNNAKDVALRLEYYPVKGATIAGVGYMQLGDRDEAGAKDRWEVDGRYEKDELLVQAEWILSRDVNSAGTALNGMGGYLAAAWRDKSNLQPAVRVGYLDPDGDTDDDQSMHFDVGLNYYLMDHQAKLQASYTRTQFGLEDKTADNLLILAAQASY